MRVGQGSDVLGKSFIDQTISISGPCSVPINESDPRYGPRYYRIHIYRDFYSFSKRARKKKTFDLYDLEVKKKQFDHIIYVL